MTITVVGDPDQLLYRFAGSKPELLTNDIDQWLPELKTIKLEINYRSQDEIIAKSQQLIGHNYSGLGGPYPQEFMKNATGTKPDKVFFPSEEIEKMKMWLEIETQKDSPDNKLISELGENIDRKIKAVQFQMYESPEHEALETANKINKLVQSGYNPGDFFVGARTSAQLGYLEGALVRAKVPFINIKGGSFWGSKHVADVVAYMRLASTSNKSALERVSNISSNNVVRMWDDKQGKFYKGDYCPVRFLGAEFLKAIKYDIKKVSSVYKAGRKGWYPQPKHGNKRTLTNGQYDLIGFVDDLKWSIKSSSHVGMVVQFIVDNCYEKYLKSQGMGDEGLSNAKLEDLQTVENLASKYTSVDKFLSYVDEMVQVAEDAENKDWDNYTVLSTIHGLKGLERKVVFGLGWSEGVCTKIGKDVGLLPFTFSLSPPPNFGVLPGGSMSPMEDERCIGFVLISRAIERCYLSGIKSYRSWVMGPSRFIYEMELTDEGN